MSAKEKNVTSTEVIVKPEAQSQSEALVVRGEEFTGLAKVDTSNTITSKLTADDIMIPKIWLMQSISKLVEEEKAKSGDMVHSIDSTIVGSRDTKPIEVIFLDLYKELITMKNGKMDRRERYRAIDHSELPFGKTVGNDGQEYEFIPTLNYYVLLTNDIKDMTAFPHVITFKKTSFKCAKKIGYKMQQLEDFGAARYAKAFKLIATKEDGEKGSYYVWDLSNVDGESKGRLTTDIEMQLAIKWINRMGNQNYQVDNSEDEPWEA